MKKIAVFLFCHVKKTAGAATKAIMLKSIFKFCITDRIANNLVSAEALGVKISHLAFYKVSIQTRKVSIETFLVRLSGFSSFRRLRVFLICWKYGQGGEI